MASDPKGRNFIRASRLCRSPVALLGPSPPHLGFGLQRVPGSPVKPGITVYAFMIKKVALPSSTPPDSNKQAIGNAQHKYVVISSIINNRVSNVVDPITIIKKGDELSGMIHAV